MNEKIKKEGHKVHNYQAFFSVGIIWFSVGIVFMSAVNKGLGIAFMALGIIYIAFSLANRDKWEKKVGKKPKI